MATLASIFSFHSFFPPPIIRKKEPSHLSAFFRDSFNAIGMMIGLLGMTSTLWGAEIVNLSGGSPPTSMTSEGGTTLANSCIIQLGVFNDEASTSTPLTTGQIATLLDGNQAQVRQNLENLFGAGKPTLWGSSTVGTIFTGAGSDSLSATSTGVFAGNPIYVLVINSTSIATATQVGIFANYAKNLTTRIAFPAIGAGPGGSVSVSFTPTTRMLPFLGSFSGGGYRLATIGNGYGITSLLTASATRNNAFSYFITANNGVTSFNATSLPAGLSINTTTGEISGTPTAVAGNYNIPLTATGPLGDRTATLVLTLSNPSGSSPSITSSLANQSTVAGVAYAGYTITGDNSPTSYSAAGLPTGLSCAAGTGVISGTPTQTGTFNVTIQATNGSGTGSSSFSLTVTAPTLLFAAKSFTLNSSGTTVAPTASGGFSPTGYSLVTSLPTGLSLNSTTGIISGTPTSVGSRTVTVSGTANGVTASGTITITVNSLTPVLNSATTVTGYVGTPITYTLSTTPDPSSLTPVTYSILGTSTVPANWLSSGLNFTTGEFQVTPTQSGIFTAKFQANNSFATSGFGGGDSPILEVTFTIEVRAPSFNNGSSAATYLTVAGTDYVSMAAYSVKTFGISQSDATAASFSNLPDWLTGTTSGLNASVSGRPTQPGTYTVRKTISNTGRGGGLQSVSRDLVITVVGNSPTASSSGFVTPPTGQVGQAYRQYITASGATRSAADPVSFNASGLPPGLSFATAADRQMGLLTGTPTRTGTYAVKFYIANPKGFITQYATMTILP